MGLWGVFFVLPFWRKRAYFRGDRTLARLARALATKVKLAMRRPPGRLWPLPNNETGLFPSTLFSKDRSQAFDRPSWAYRPPPPKGIKFAPTNPVWTLQRCKLLIFVDIDSKRVQYLANSDRKSTKWIGEWGNSPLLSPPPGCATAPERAQIYIVCLHTC